MTQILIQAKDFEVTEALRAACQKCAGKLLNREEVGEKIEFFLEYEGRGDAKTFTAKIALARSGRDIFVEEKAADMYLAIRAVCKKARLAFDDHD
jgi:ribosome-associated translation inhibitor RaiA